MHGYRLTSLGLAIVFAVLSGCGGGSDQPWGIDPYLVGIWELRDLTEDGLPVYFDPKVMVFRADGTWRSDTADGSWSSGTYQTRAGRLNYRILASDDPANVGHAYTFDYEVVGGTMSISGRHRGHYYVATFAAI